MEKTSSNRNRLINIFAFLILALLLLARFNDNYGWYTLQNSFRESREATEKRNQRLIEYKQSIKEIYVRADSNYQESIQLIETLRLNYSEKEADLDYVSARIYLENNKISKAEIYLDKFTQNGNKAPRFSELYAFYLIKKNNLKLAEQYLLDASQTNPLYTYQLGNLYEMTNRSDAAYELYDALSKTNYKNFEQALNRKVMLTQKTPTILQNIELTDDSNRKIFMLGGLHF